VIQVCYADSNKKFLDWLMMTPWYELCYDKLRLIWVLSLNTHLTKIQGPSLLPQDESKSNILFDHGNFSGCKSFHTVKNHWQKPVISPWKGAGGMKERTEGGWNFGKVRKGKI
jgi:hypothetical protein